MRNVGVGRVARGCLCRVASAFAVCLLAPCLLAASPGSDEPQGPPDVPAAASAKPDFMLGRPRAWVAVRGTLLVPRADGELFTFVSEHLTVDRSDLRTPAFTGEVGFAIAPRVDSTAGVEFGQTSVSSEYRHYIDNLGLPINQTTRLKQTNIFGSVKLALLDKGRSISQYAFIPRTLTPYVGAGAGTTYYRFNQQGDFVDFVTLRVFQDRFDSSGWSLSAHALGGADIRVWRMMSISLEGKYVWGHDDLSSDFVDFNGIDLNGFRFSTGVSFVVH